MRVIEPASWVAQPWKNGAGTTHELVRWPETGAFAIRISVAEITAPAPFSAFTGYRRWLYLLDGGPVTLAIDGADTVLAAPGDGVAFAGEASVAATVVARPSHDLNFMVEASRTARCELVRGPARLDLAGSAAAVFVIDGDVTVDGRPLGPRACAWATGEHVVVELAAGALAVSMR